MQHSGKTAHYLLANSALPVPKIVYLGNCSLFTASLLLPAAHSLSGSLLKMTRPLPPHSRLIIRRFLFLWLPVFTLGISCLAVSIFELRISVSLQVILFILAAALLNILAINATVKLLHRMSEMPFLQIAEAAKLVSGGVTTARAPHETMPTSESYRAAEAVNALADKAGKDIAEMKKLERVRSEFLGNVSHELRTPIFSIQGYLETLLDGALEDKDVSRKFVERAHQNTKRLNVLLSDLIDISKIESGEMRLSFRYFNLCDIIRETIASLEFQAAQSEIELTSTCQNDQELMVYGDKERLAQVIVNIMQNAIKYNREKGSVRVVVETRAQDVKVRIIDTGIGIPDEQKSRIFERFYRVDAGRSRSVGGTGLGLAIVKHILEAHQAPFGVESTLGVGTEIWMVLKR